MTRATFVKAGTAQPATDDPGAADVFFNWMPLDHGGGTVFQFVPAS